MKMLTLTDLHGGTVYLMPTWIQYVREVRAGEQLPPEAKTVLILSGERLEVQETAAFVTGMLEKV